MRTNPARGPEGLPRRIAAQPIDQGAWEQASLLAATPLRATTWSGPGSSMSRRIAEPVPPELPGLPPRPRVLQLTDGDCVSHGLADGTRRQRASDQEVRSCLDRVHATARLLDPHAPIPCAVSTETAICHLAVLAAARNNLFTIRRGLDGADWALLEELADLIDVRMVAARPGRKRQAQVADLVILVGKDGICTHHRSGGCGRSGSRPGCSCQDVPPPLRCAGPPVRFHTSGPRPVRHGSHRASGRRNPARQSDDTDPGPEVRSYTRRYP